MKRMLSYAWWLLRNFEEVIGCICIGGMGLITAYNVFCRYFLNSARSWAEELAVILLIWATFMGCSACYKRNLHAGMDFLVVRLPKKIQHYVRVFNSVVLLALFVYMTKISFDFTRSITKTTTYFRLSYFYLDLAVVICFASMSVYTCVFLYQAFKTPEKFDARFETFGEDEELIEGGSK